MMMMILRELRQPLNPESHTFEPLVAVHPVADDATEEKHATSAGKTKYGSEEQPITIHVDEVETDCKLPHPISLQNKFNNYNGKFGSIFTNIKKLTNELNCIKLSKFYLVSQSSVETLHAFNDGLQKLTERSCGKNLTNRTYLGSS